MTALLQDYAARAAESRGGATAVVMGDERLSYAELELQGNRLARLLAEYGCQPGDRVCLLVPKRPITIAAEYRRIVNTEAPAFDALLKRNGVVTSASNP